MKKLILSLIGFCGVIILFVGAGLPMRLPREQRDLGKEALATVVGLGLAFVPVFLMKRGTESSGHNSAQDK
jgi:hypothetical protein